MHHAPATTDLPAATMPWILTIDAPSIELLRDGSEAMIQFVALLQEQAELVVELQRQRAEWRAPTLIHGDLTWDNLLVVAGQQREDALRLVDWEMAGLGDPAWDAGSFISEFLTSWVFSIPVAPGEMTARTELATFPLERAQPAMRAFWNAYTAERDISDAVQHSLLNRIVRCAAVRLLQSAIERLQGETRLTGHAILLLQLSLNILRAPGDAAHRLILPPPAPEAT
jgi:thiamine kinase-like enzyme